MKAKAVIEAIEALEPELWELASFIHSHPELSGEEHRSSQAAIDFLQKHGFSVTAPYQEISTSFHAEASKPWEGPRIALLAEYDALPQIGHACGHNLIAAMSVGAAVALKKGAPDFSPGIVVIGTPEEERGGGKIKLLKAGAFKDISVAMMVHPSNTTEVAKKALSLIEVEVAFHGKAAHAAAAPEKGINALDAVILLFNGVSLLRQHLRRDARIHGIISKGGDAPNVIPDYAAAHFYLRAADMTYSYELLNRFQEIVAGAEKVTGARAEIQVNEILYQPFQPSLPLAQLFERHLRDLGVEVEESSEGFGSSDIGNLSQVMPTIHPTLAISPREIVCHSSAFTEASVSEKGRQGMSVGAKALALTALELFEDPDQLRAVVDGFKARHSVEPW
ncbi:MAG: M20 family metallopeptidase [Deltaproteobacteria bacterium]|nr:M20 family metallopeptidase [Deltaproteobacteria bacterium]